MYEGYNTCDFLLLRKPVFTVTPTENASQQELFYGSLRDRRAVSESLLSDWLI